MQAVLGTINKFFLLSFVLFFNGSNYRPRTKAQYSLMQKKESNEFQKALDPDLFHNLLMIALIQTYIAMPL